MPEAAFVWKGWLVLPFLFFLAALVVGYALLSTAE
jgi:hypothetical protein